jgi:hypothetical protein
MISFGFEQDICQFPSFGYPVVWLMRRYPLVFILLAAQILIGCATGDQLKAKNAMEALQAAYEKCLEQNPLDHSKCEPLKRKYDADLKAYRELHDRTGPIVTGFIEVGPEDCRH